MDQHTARTIDTIRRRLAPMERDAPPPASAGDVESVTAWFEGRYPGQVLPPSLTELWASHNGVGFNGVYIYAARRTGSIDDVVEINELYVDDYPDHFLIGQSDDVFFYAWRPSMKVFERLGQGDFEGITEVFHTFDDLFNHVFEERL